MGFGIINKIMNYTPIEDESFQSLSSGQPLGSFSPLSMKFSGVLPKPNLTQQAC